MMKQRFALVQRVSKGYAAKSESIDSTDSTMTAVPKQKVESSNLFGRSTYKQKNLRRNF